jgi:hypothetical protein
MSQISGIRYEGSELPDNCNLITQGYSEETDSSYYAHNGRDGREWRCRAFTSSSDTIPCLSKTKCRLVFDARSLDQPPAAHHFHETFSKTAMSQLSGGARARSRIPGHAEGARICSLISR